MTIRTGAIGAGLVAAAFACAVPGAAQDVFSLPPGTASPTARPAGPVDSDSPVVRPGPTQPAAAQPATGQPAPSPTATPTSAPTTAATPAPSRTRPPARAAATAPAAPRQGAVGAASPAALPDPANQSTAAASPTIAPTVAAVLPEAAPAEAPATDWAAFATGALMGALGLLALVGGLIWRRRKPDEPAQPDFDPPVVPAPPAEPKPAPQPEAPASQPAAPAPQPEAPAPQPAAPAPQPAAPAPQPAAPEKPAPAAKQPDGLQIVLESRRLDASIMAATLVYELRVTNHGAAPLNALAIEGDMVAAHASLPMEQQIAGLADKLELKHTLPALGPGESAELKGEMRLPLAAITPIRAGDAAYFVPLARLRVNAADGAAAVAQTYVVGELPAQPGGALRPFRLDLGPRTYSKLGQRAVG